MKYCQRCNQNFPDTTSFCQYCGSRLNEIAPMDVNKPRCPNCGAVVEPGWKFCSNCRIELPPNAGSWQYQQSSMPLSPSMPKTVPPAPFQPMAGNKIFVRCRTCKNLVEENAVVCDRCGANMMEESAPPPIQPPASIPAQQPAPPPYTPRQQASDPAEIWTQGLNSNQSALVPTAATYLPQTVPTPSTDKVKKDAPTLGMFENYAETPPQSQSSKWLGVIAVGLILLALAAAGGWYLWSRRGAAAQSSPQTTSSPGAMAQTSTASQSTSSAPASQAGASTSAAGGPADEEAKQIRQRRIAASPAERDQIIAAISEAEKKYPTDYRFPYERAKLSIKGIVSHDEAFNALFSAAEKAIDSGKAEEMLNSLTTDKEGDFYKLSRGHHEWAALEKALRDKDKSALKSGTHHH